MKVLITGSDGFIARNFIAHLNENDSFDVLSFNRGNDLRDLSSLVERSDIVFHLAGVNRSRDANDFEHGNVSLTEAVCKAVVESGRKIPVVYGSSVHAVVDNNYGRSKLRAEDILLRFSNEFDFPIAIYRLPNVFGKWAKPNYNSVVATFCYNVARSLPLTVNDPNYDLRLVYVDDVVKEFLGLLVGGVSESGFKEVGPEYSCTVGQLALKIQGFREGRDSLFIGSVGEGFCRALYSTYLSYLPSSNFDYCLPRYGDERGEFVEFLKTEKSGQFSFFTSRPGVTRGGHYHHSKNEKFLVVRGRASFRFRNILSDEFYEINTDDSEARVVETVPGWVHDITNTGDVDLVVILWANEVFDRSKPDTYPCPISNG